MTSAPQRALGLARATSPSIASANSAPGLYVGVEFRDAAHDGGQVRRLGDPGRESLEVELDRAPARLGAEDLGREVVQVADRGVVELPDERVAGGEVAVDRAGADAGAHREFVERRLDAALGEQGPRLDEEPLMIAPRIATRRCVRVHVFTVRLDSGMIRRVDSVSPEPEANGPLGGEGCGAAGYTPV